MNKINTLEDALNRIDELEKECERLQLEIEVLKNRKTAGRKKHDAGWQASYDLFLSLYENGVSIPLIVEQTGISRRTIYRYKAYYDALNSKLNKA